ncbi:MAG: M24 family metallopeptidase [Candidatus Aminicenantia bacterium]
MNLKKIQQILKEKNIDGWLLYDFHNRDLLAYRILGLDSSKLTSRRWFYFIPSEGEPIKLVHPVEKFKLDLLPGIKKVYLAWTELHTSLKEILGKPKKIAMQYSPNQNIPYVSIVDGGLIDLIRSFGHEIVSSADLVQTFEAIIDEKGYKLHLETNRIINNIKNQAFEQIERAIRENRKVSEYDLQQFIINKFKENNLTCDEEFPIVGINDHPADPHFEPTPENSYFFKKGDTVLIDLWARRNIPEGIYADITWCGYIGEKPPQKYLEIFNIVKDARITAVNFIRDKFTRGEPCFGWEVDEACRNIVKEAGYGKYFVHRTGHSIGHEVHGNGVNIDNLETKDDRQLVPGICFSIEPGIYLEGEMAVRTEINVFINHNGQVEITTEEQMNLIKII